MHPRTKPKAKNQLMVWIPHADTHNAIISLPKLACDPAPAMRPPV